MNENWLELKNKILGKMIVEGWAEKSVYEIEPYLELIYKLGLENSHKDLLKFLEDNKEHWITGLMYICDPDIEDQWKICETHIDLILEDIKKFSLLNKI